MTDAIRVTGLTKRFGGRTVVDAVDLTVAEGRIMGFLGPNGSGKTTTIRMLCGLLGIDGGEGEVLGLDIRRDTAAIKRQAGYMTQRFSLYEDMTVGENLDFAARVHGVPERRARVGAALDRMGLGGRRDQLAGHLSGGWKQRLALAATILHKPRLLLLDEPTAGVDPQARREFWDRIHGFAAEGMTVLVSTHYMDEAERCHAIAYIAYGRLLATGTVAEVTRAAGLAAAAVSGGDAELVRRVKALPAVETATAMGAEIHVAGPDAAALAADLDRLAAAEGLAWKTAEPNLEDVFIHLMADNPDPAEARR
ncbi:ABC transporter, ATP-binding protein, putative (fragment) [uncultured Alphaproteobacteria bacterium]|uniref:ABC transporter, ATP-binding protein, putative n=1 Tax=uncultured Alphaproteobacteria bacterium TaxID=91750 RepID=A0A212KMX0_9PROT